MPGTISGRGGMFYLQGSGAAAAKLGEMKTWKFKIDRKLDEDWAAGDLWDTQLEISKKFSVDVTGNFDTADNTPFEAAVATSAVKFYAYPVASDTAKYYYGSIWPTLDVDMADKTAAFSLSGAGYGPLSKN